jgi:phage baseplate assembly protein W
MATITRTTQIFRDFDLAFSAHPNTGDLAILKNEDAIKQAVKILVLTNFYERPFHSELGSPVRNLLFELATPLTIHTLRRAITDVIENFEPRVRVDSVDVSINDDTNGCNVTLQYTIIGLQTIQELNITIERTR